jgi:hypothetical protein
MWVGGPACARCVPDPPATGDVERSAADKARTAVDLRTHGQSVHDKPVPKLTVVQHGSKAREQRRRVGAIV